MQDIKLIDSALEILAICRLDQNDESCVKQIESIMRQFSGQLLDNYLRGDEIEIEDSCACNLGPND